MITLRHQFAFRPVGQGLFAHGTLLRRDGCEPYEYLYDCGSMSRVSLLQNQIHQYCQQNQRGIIDLAMLSHYDQDHVNGMTELIQTGIRIRTLVLPYLYPQQRARLILEFAGAATWYQRFLAAPASYFLSLESEGVVDQVILISPSEGEPPPPEPELIPGDLPPNGPLDSFSKYQKRSRRNIKLTEDNGNGYSDDSDLNSPRTQLLQHNQINVALNLWEFCFYNRPVSDFDLQTWWQDAKPHWDAFQKSHKNPRDYQDLIDKMPQATTKNPSLQSSAFSANEISLQVYSGPLTQRFDSGNRSNRIVSYDKIRDHSHQRIWPTSSPSTASVRDTGGFLFTGDITMDIRTSGLIENRFLGSDRWQRLSYLQVPHHGSVHSWEPRTYHGWHHEVSIFSARGSQYHPHVDVVKDLASRQPVFVNKHQGLIGVEEFQYA